MIYILLSEKEKINHFTPVHIRPFKIDFPSNGPKFTLR